jgi:hypothetical protein
MADELLHEPLQWTNNYKELCAHLLRRDNALLKEICEIFDQELSHLFFQRKPSANLYACQDQFSCI